MNKKNKIAQETAKLLLSIKAITFSPKKPYRFTSGILSPIYCDNRIVISYPKIREKIVDFYLYLIKKNIGLRKIDLISGTATAAITHAMLIADRLKRPMIYVEVSKKEINEAKIRGKVDKGEKTIIIEDHISTAGSAVSNALAVRRAGGIVHHCIGTTTYNMKKALESFKQNKITLFSLTDINSILNTAIEFGYLKESEKKIVEEWVKDPPSWGKKMGFE